MDYLKEIECKESMKIVTSNSFITACNLEKISLKARKLLYIAISQCKKTDQDFFKYSLSVKDFAEMMNVAPSNVYQMASDIADELTQGFIKVVPEGKKRFINYTLFQKIEYTENGSIEFKINQEMTDFFLGLKKNFSQPLLNDFLRMNSTYSMAIWHLMQREMHSKKPGVTNEIVFDLALEELREVTGTQAKFKQIIEFRRKVFDKAIREIKDNCGVMIEYTYIKKSRTIVGFHCTAISEFRLEEDKISQESKDKVKWFKLNQKAQKEALTNAEQEEYDRLSVALGKN